MRPKLLDEFDFEESLIRESYSQPDDFLEEVKSKKKQSEQAIEKAKALKERRAKARREKRELRDSAYVKYLLSRRRTRKP
jgi:hypothetical protein